MDEFQKMIGKIRQRCPYNPKPEQESEYECRKCKDTGFIFKTDENGYEVACRCECYEIRQSREMMRRRGISGEFQKKTFDNFSTDCFSPSGNKQLINAKCKAIQYVEHFEVTEHDRYNSIMFTGQVGAGKTHLGTAICGALMKKGVAVIYMAYRNAVTKIKQNIIDESVYNRELNQYTLARVLYIDDLLKGRLTDADINIMYEIVNYRYMNNLPVIISTEKTPNELIEFDEAIGSRLLEMCRGNIIHLHGKELNYRLN